MAATGHKGIDVRQTGNRIISDIFLLDYAGSLVTSGTTNLYFYELQDDGSLKSFDFSDYTFKATALTNETTGMVHRTGNNSTTNTGLWTLAVSNVSGFTIGAIYYARARNVLATPADQIVKFQYGSAEGDITVNASSRVDTTAWLASTIHTGAVIPTVTNVTNVTVPSSSQIASAVWIYTTRSLTNPVTGIVTNTVVASGIDAIKLKTDSLTFTVSGMVDSNIQYVNDILVTGTGAPGNEWGP